MNVAPDPIGANERGLFDRNCKFGVQNSRSLFTLSVPVSVHPW